MHLASLLVVVLGYRVLSRPAIQIPSTTGPVSTGDAVIMMEGMGIGTGLQVAKVIKIGRMSGRIGGRRLRAVCAHL